MKYNSTTATFTRTRAIRISPLLLNQKHNLRVYNGKSFTTINFKSDMIGYNLGQFVFTKRLGKIIHNTERNKKRKKRKK